MNMTFDQYTQNPMGVANAVFSAREMYRAMYTEKLNKIMVREMGKITYHLYKSKSKYYTYIKVPSEVVDKFYYDVIIEFTPPKDIKSKTSRTLKDYTVRFYSNDPSFVFTFTHAFIKNGMFITEFSDKMSKEAIKHKATMKNPKDEVGYVKSIYFAYLIMQKYDLFNKIKYFDKYDEKHVKRMVMDADTKIAQRTEEGAKKSKGKKKAARELKELSDRKNIIPREMQTRQTSSSNKIRTTKSTPSMVKKTSNVKKTKITGKK